MSDASRSRHYRSSHRASRASVRRPSIYEPLENRLMFVVFPVTGTAGDDVITLSLTGANVVATVNGTPSGLPDSLVTSVTINAQGGNDTVLIHSNGNNPVTVNAGAGVDSVQVAPTSENLDNIGADVTVNGDGDADTATLFDANRASGLAYVFATGNSMQRASGPTYTFNTVELAELDGGSGNDFYSFTAMPTLPLSLTDNGGGGTIQINGNGTQNIVYEPDGAATSKGSLDLGAQDVEFGGMNGIFCADLNNILVITPNPQDAITITQATAINNRLTGTSGGVAMTPLHWNTIDNAFQLELGLNDNGATTNAVTMTGDLIGSPRVDLNGSLTTDGGTSSVTVNDGTWSLNLNVSPNRIAWSTFLSGAGTDVTFAVDEEFIRLEVGGGATARLSGIGNDAFEFAAPSGTGTVEVATGGLFEVFSRFDIGAGDRLRKTGAGRMLVGTAATQAHGAGGVLEVDAGIFDLNSDAGSPASRTLSVDSSATVRLGSTQHLAGVFADIGGRISMNPNGSRVLVVTDAAVNGEGGQIDLADNDMIVDYTGPSQLDNVFHLIRGGFSAGSWGGIGIATSTGATNPSRALGYAEATDLFTTFPATFAGQAVDNTTVLVKHTFFGDHDLNGNVNLTDFNKLAANFGQSNRRWIHGDNDYNGTINLADFNKLAATFGATGLATAARDGATHDRQSIATDVLNDSEAIV